MFLFNVTSDSGGATLSHRPYICRDTEPCPWYDKPETPHLLYGFISTVILCIDKASWFMEKAGPLYV